MQVEQLRLVDLRVADELPAVIADGALNAAVSKDEFRTRRVAGIAQRGAELAGFAGFLVGDAAELAQRGQHIVEEAQGVGFRPGRDARPGDDEGDADRMLVEVLLADQAVAAARHAGA